MPAAGLAADERRADPVRDARARAAGHGRGADLAAPALDVRDRLRPGRRPDDRLAVALRPRGADQRRRNRDARRRGRATRSRSRASPTARSAGGSKNPATALCSPTRPARWTRPAAALLSATGDYGPLLLLDSATQIPPPLAAYLGDIQPAYTSPVPPGPRRLQSRLADRRRSGDRARHAGRTGLAARDHRAQDGRWRRRCAGGGRMNRAPEANPT